jgi:hypothetical protein
MSAAAATAAARGHGRKAQQRRLMMIAGAVALLVVFYALAKSKSSTSTATGTVDPTAPYFDPASGEWIDPNTGMPVNQLVNPSANDTGGSFNDPLAGLTSPMQVELVDASGNPVVLPTGGSDNNNAGTGSSDAPPPGPASTTQPTAPPHLSPSQFTVQQLAALGAPGAGPSPFTEAETTELAHQFGSMTPAALTALGIGPQPAGTVHVETLFSTATAPAPHAAATPVTQPAAPTPAAPTPAPVEHQAAVPPPPPHRGTGPMVAF